MENYKKIKKMVLDMENDIDKIFVKDQATAAIRVRRQLQQIRDLSKELRQDIQDHLKSKDDENNI